MPGWHRCVALAWHDGPDQRPDSQVSCSAGLFSGLGEYQDRGRFMPAVLGLDNTQLMVCCQW